MTISPTFWQLTTPDPVDIGTDDLTFEPVYGAQQQATIPVYAVSAAETAAGIVEGITMGTVVDTSIAWGNVERYGNNTTPGTTDMAAAFTSAHLQSVKAGGAPVVGYAAYLLGSTVDLRAAVVDLEASAITINHAGVGLVAGGNGGSNMEPTQRYGTVTRATAFAANDVSATPTLRIVGPYAQTIHVGFAGFLQVYCDSDTNSIYLPIPGIAATSRPSAAAYNTFHFNRCFELEILGNLSTDHGTSPYQWCNENTFYLNRIDHFTMDGTYSHNNNHFYEGSFEGASPNPHSVIDFRVGGSNTFHSIRGEGYSPSNYLEVKFGAGTRWNTVIQSWQSSESSFRSGDIYGATNYPTTDLGLGNQVIHQSNQFKETLAIGRADYSDVVLNNQVQLPSRTPSLAVVKSAGALNVIETSMVRVYKNDIIGFYVESADGVNCLYRCSIYCYDENRRRLDIVDDVDYETSQMSTLTLADGTEVIGDSIGHSEPTALLITDTIAFIKMTVRSSSGQTTNALANSVTAFIRRQTTDGSRALRTTIPVSNSGYSSPHPVTAPPTQGYAPLGYTAIVTATGATHSVIRSVDTTITVAQTSADAQVTVADATGATAGDIIGILNDDNYITDWRTINSAAGTPTLTLTGGNLTGNCAIGNRCVFLKWT